MSIYDIENEFASAPKMRHGFEIGAQVRQENEAAFRQFKTVLFVGPNGRLDVASHSNEELIILRSVLRSLPASTIRRVKWDPQAVIADIDAELHRRRDAE